MDSSRRCRRGPARLPRDTDISEFLLRLSPEDREEAIGLLGPEERDGLDRDWPSWAHEGQIVPAKCPDGSDWSTCVIMGGRGFGKTRAGSEWIVSLLRQSEDARRGRRSRKPLFIALVGATIDDARKVMVLGPSGLMRIAGPWIREWRRKEGTLIFSTGAEAQLFSGHTPELLRGPEHDHAWCDELAKWEKPKETWDMLQLGLRRGDHPRALVTTTPRPGPVLRGIMAESDCVTIGGPTDANPHNSERWRKRMKSKYAGTRLEKQELHGELLTDNAGALWTVELLERCRAGDTIKTAHPEEAVSLANRHLEGPHFTRMIIAVDPPAGDGTCGIVACARDEAGIAHVLADHSVTARSPEGWSRAVADAAKLWGDLCPGVPIRIVAEANQGGNMVASVIRTADPELRVRLVSAIGGKSERAAPVAMLFEAGKVTLHGRFEALEAELCGMIAGGGYEPVWSGGPGLSSSGGRDRPGRSPDRADAMVWALTELMLGKQREPRIWGL